MRRIEEAGASRATWLSVAGTRFGRGAVVVTVRRLAASSAAALSLGLVALSPGLGQERRVAPATAQAAQGFPVATEARLGGDGKQTRFILDLTRKVEVRAFTL